MQTARHSERGPGKCGSRRRCGHVWHPICQLPGQQTHVDAVSETLQKREVPVWQGRPPFGFLHELEERMRQFIQAGRDGETDKQFVLVTWETNHEMRAMESLFPGSRPIFDAWIDIAEPARNMGKLGGKPSLRDALMTFGFAKGYSLPRPKGGYQSHDPGIDAV